MIKSVVLFVKENKPNITEIKDFLTNHFADVYVFSGNRFESFPTEANDIKPDLLISYLSPWIIPKKTINNTKFWNINFHPGPPQYPGIGCFNFALYDESKEYGVTSHLMETKVDTGKIISVKSFEILKTETILSLSIKSYAFLYTLFIETINNILIHQCLPESTKKWARKPYKRTELENLCKIEMGMSKKEIQKRVKATTYPGMPGAYIEIEDFKFEFNPNR